MREIAFTSRLQKAISTIEDTTSAPSDVVPPVRPFRALRQPA